MQPIAAEGRMVAERLTVSAVSRRFPALDFRDRCLCVARTSDRAGISRRSDKATCEYDRDSGAVSFQGKRRLQQDPVAGETVSLVD